MSEEYVDAPPVTRIRRGEHSPPPAQEQVESPPVSDPSVPQPPPIPETVDVATDTEYDDGNQRMLVPIIGLAIAVLLLLAMIGVAVLPDQLNGLLAMRDKGKDSTTEDGAASAQDVESETADDAASENSDADTSNIDGSTSNLTISSEPPSAEAQGPLFQAPATIGDAERALAGQPNPTDTAEDPQTVTEDTTATANPGEAVVVASDAPQGPVAIGELNSEVDLLVRFDSRENHWYRIPSQWSLFS